MKNFIILLALILGGAGGYFGWKYFVPHQNAKRNFAEPFMWSVDVGPSPVAKYSIDLWAKQMSHVTKLGAKWIRLGFDNKPSDKFEIFDEMVDYARSRDINIIMGLDSTTPVTEVEQPYQDGQKVCGEVSAHFKGRVRFYQILNEQGGTVIKSSGFSGENESDFDQAKYQQVLQWSKGCSSAIRKNDPDAWSIISVNWIHVAYLDMIIRDGVDFDIIGWDWYSDMNMMGDKVLADGTLLTDRIKKYNKPVILAEVNAQPNKNGTNQQEQADFVKAMAEWAYNSGFIHGFNVHTLVDGAPYAGQTASYYGLVEFKKSGSSYTLGDIKPAFTAYQEVIKKYSNQ